MPVESVNHRTETPLEIRGKIKRDYVFGKGSVRSLAQAYGVNPLTVEAWAAGEKWTDARDVCAIDQVVKVAEQIARLDTLIDAATISKEIQALWRAKRDAMELHFWLTCKPRPGVAKPEKPKSNELLRRLEEAARRRAEQAARESPPGLPAAVPAMDSRQD